jgi:hypothetical protein
MADKSETSQDAGKEEEIEDTIYDKGEEGKKEEEPKKEEAKSEEPKKEEKKEEPKKEEAKKEEEPKFELKLPKGSLLDASALERIVSFAKEQGLTPKHAQALLDRESNLLTEHADGQKKAFDAVTSEWVEQSKQDKEFGGEKFAENAELAKRVVHRFGSKELLNGLNETKFGNHPELVRMLVRIGKAMSEDQLVMPGKSTAATKDMADVFYGGSTEKQ